MGSKAATIADVMRELDRIRERVEATHNLAVKTNGRVTELEKQAIAHQAVSLYKERTSRSKQWAYILVVTVVAPVVGVIAAKLVS